MMHIIAAVLFLTALASPAHAGFLVPIIGGILGGITVGSVVSFGLSLAASVGLSFLASALFKPKTPERVQAKQTVGGAQLDLRIDADIPMSLIVGEAVVAGSRAYAETYGYIPATDTVETIRNSNLIEIIALADHPCESLEKVFVEGTERGLTDTGGTRGHTVNDYSQKLALKFYDGSQAEADAFAVAALGDHDERPWTANCIGTGITYVRLHSIYDQNNVPGVLQWKFVVKGIRLYDPRKDTTAGGDGAHRFNDLDTHEFTKNLAVIAYNILRGIRVKDSGGNLKHFYGLENTPAANLPLANWFAAMNACDEEIDGAPQYHGGAEITVDTPPLDVIKELMKACDGRLAEMGGIYKLYIGAPGLPVLSITDESLLADEADPFKPLRPLTDRINYVTGKYTSPDDGWTPKIAPPRENPDWEELDGRRLPADLDAPMVQSDAHMQRLMQQMMRKARQQRRHVLPLGPEAFGLEPGDSIEWNSTRHGYVDKIVRVDAVDIHSNLNVTAAVTEEDPDDYDWEAETDLLPTPAPPSLVWNRPSPKVLQDFAAEAYLHAGDNGALRPGIRLTWTPPEDDDVNGVAIQLRRADLPDDIVNLSIDSDGVEAGQTLILSGLASLTDYDVRARFRSFNGYATEWSLWIPVTTPDARLGEAELNATLTAKLQALDATLAESLQGQIEWLQGQIEALSKQAGGQFAILEKRGNVHINSIGQRVGNTQAEVTRLTLTVADGATATAALIESVNAAVGDVSAQSTYRAVASADPATGAIASVDIQVRASAGSEWAFTGLQLAAYDDGAGGVFGRARLYGDLVELGSLVEGVFAPIFAVQQNNSTPKISLIPEALPDNIISTRNLVAGAAEETYLIAGTDISRTIANWYNSGSGDIAMSAEVPVDAGDLLMIDYFGVAEMPVATAGGYRGSLKLVVNDVTIKEVDLGAQTQVGGTYRFNEEFICFNWPVQVDSDDAASIVIRHHREATGDGTLNFSNQRLVVTRKKKPLFFNLSTTLAAATVDWRGVTYGGATTTFEDVDIGTAGVRRMLAIAVVWQSFSQVIPTVKVDGVATQVVNCATQAGLGFGVFSLMKSVGATADIEVSGLSSFSDLAIGVVAIEVQTQSPASLRTEGATSTGASVGSTLVPSVKADGALLTFAAVLGSASDITSTNEGDGMTQHFDGYVDTGVPIRLGVFSELTPATASSNTVVATGVDLNGWLFSKAISWR